MKNIYTFILITYCFTFFNTFSQQIAFPGAEGYGKYAIGGRNGSVYHVTNLNDSGTGSFRDAISQPNRIIVFDVGGVINTVASLIASSNLYIAGQTAPGEGITIYGNRITFTGADHTICRHIRFRMGVIGSSGKDACGLAHGSHMIFDHVSVSWGRDENFSINWDNKGAEPNHITIQNSIIAQGLLTHSAGGLIQTNGGVTLFRNLYVDNGTRNNKVKGINQYVNNIVYNWKDAAYIMGGDSDGDSYVNVEKNYFIKGPENGNTPLSSGNELFHIYANENWFDSSLDAILNGYDIPRDEYGGNPDFKDEPYDYPILPTIHTSKLYSELIPDVGASLPYRDYADYYVINEVKSLGKEGLLISDERNLPFGAPSNWSLWRGEQRTDTDNDGMPDDWEENNGTNKTLDDAMVLATNGYANIENYINGITKANSQEYLRVPLNFMAESNDQTSITFNWLDYTYNEEGFVLERYVNGIFVPIDTACAESKSVTLSGLQPEETDTFRLYAFKGSLKSIFTENIIAKSLPLVLTPIHPDTFIPDLVWSGSINNNWDNSTKNWINGTNTATFNSNTKVLFDDTNIKDQSIYITENVAINNMFIKSDYNYSFSGTGSISGKGSVNKTGSGELTLGTNNTYTGPTVIWDGSVNINKLANGGETSSLGSSSNYYFNLVFEGGKLNYTGESVSTDRSILLDKTGELSIASPNTTVTMHQGNITGTGGFIKSGEGTLNLLNGIGNDYQGETTINKGNLSIHLNSLTSLNNVIGNSGVVNLAGGNLNTINGQSSNYEKYDFEMNIPTDKKGGFAPYRNCYINCTVSGGGTLNYTIPYVREYIKGDWTHFTGILYAYGKNTNDGSQLLLDNSVGLPTTRIYTTGNTKIVCWQNAGTMYLGGLSGDTGTSLSGADKKNKAATMTWIVGGANTNETFNGVINDECSSASYSGTTSIVKEGCGTWRLSGQNTYSGTTTVSNGTLIINGSHSNKGSITISEGAKLAGKGMISGVVNVQAGAIIEPGDSDVSTLTVGTLNLSPESILNIDIDKSSGNNDIINATEKINLGGTLHLNITGNLTDGDEFTILSGNTSYEGSFEDITPSIPGNQLKWEFSEGVLKVVSNYATNIKNHKMQEYQTSIVPNPIINVCNIKLSKKCNQVEIKVISIVGNVIQVIQKNDCTELNIDFTDKPTGIYFIKIKGDGYLIKTSKLIKK